jgi:chemotaxis protein CheD
LNVSGPKIIVVGVAELYVCTDPQAVLITCALGSCVGVVLYDHGASVGGMLHFMLPDSRLNPGKAGNRPAMFGDRAVPLLLEEMFAKGARRKNLEVRLAGGASSFKEGSVFDIGARNVLMARKALWRNSLAALAEDVGGNESRTVRLYMDTGKVTVKNGKGEHEI